MIRSKDGRETGSSPPPGTRFVLRPAARGCHHPHTGVSCARPPLGSRGRPGGRRMLHRRVCNRRPVGAPHPEFCSAHPPEKDDLRLSRRRVARVGTWPIAIGIAPRDPTRPHCQSSGGTLLNGERVGFSPPSTNGAAAESFAPTITLGLDLSHENGVTAPRDGYR